MSASVAAPRAPGDLADEAGQNEDHITRWQAIRSSPSLHLAGRRLLAAIPVLWGVTFITYLVLNMLPGDAASALLGANATPAEVHALSIKLHLNQPLLVRYWHWLTGVLSGNLGDSLANGQPVASILANRLPVTTELVVYSFIVTLVIATPLGILAARKPRGILDRITMVLSMGGLSIAQFVFALLLILLLAVTFPVFPALGWVPISGGLGSNLKFLTLPALTIGIPFACFYTRLLRADLLEQMDSQEYVVTARAKGLGRWTILTRHALRNSLIGLLTIIGLNLAVIFGTTVIVEAIFGLPGVGAALLTALSDRDAPLMEGIVLVFSGVTVLANLLTDVLYGVLDPRIRHGRSPV